ncbi:hypothetical protein GCK32_016704 [Trichostrongylus colubriformis]|uniref:Uncharacterized protein n=1 Tax=Trichostrongylus colubriformis TaxID=6319 RepID=A0AAN8FKJ5_TRICO
MELPSVGDAAPRRENRFLKLDLQYMLGWQCANIEQMYLSKPLTQCVDAVREVFPKCSIQYSRTKYPFVTADSEYDTNQA